jgi:hypothetical protein
VQVTLRCGDARCQPAAGRERQAAACCLPRWQRAPTAHAFAAARACRYEQRIKLRYLAEQGHQAPRQGSEPLQKAGWLASWALLCCLAVKYLARLPLFDAQACPWAG